MASEASSPGLWDKLNELIVDDASRATPGGMSETLNSLSLLAV